MTMMMTMMTMTIKKSGTERHGPTKVRMLRTSRTKVPLTLTFSKKRSVNW